MNQLNEKIINQIILLLTPLQDTYPNEISQIKNDIANGDYTSLTSFVNSNFKELSYSNEIKEFVTKLVNSNIIPNTYLEIINTDLFTYISFDNPHFIFYGTKPLNVKYDTLVTIKEKSQSTITGVIEQNNQYSTRDFEEISFSSLEDDSTLNIDEQPTIPKEEISFDATLSSLNSQKDIPPIDSFKSLSDLDSNSFTQNQNNYQIENSIDYSNNESTIQPDLTQATTDLPEVDVQPDLTQTTTDLPEVDVQPDLTQTTTDLPEVNVQPDLDQTPKYDSEKENLKEELNEVKKINQELIEEQSKIEKQNQELRENQTKINAEKRRLLEELENREKERKKLLLIQKKIAEEKQALILEQQKNRQKQQEENMKLIRKKYLEAQLNYINNPNKFIESLKNKNEFDLYNSLLELNSLTSIQHILSKLDSDTLERLLTYIQTNLSEEKHNFFITEAIQKFLHTKKMH